MEYQQGKEKSWEVIDVGIDPALEASRPDDKR
jgi:hypothetical protein